MRREDAQGVARQYLLPTKDTSRRILKTLEKGSVEACEFQYPAAQERLSALARRYSAKVAQLSPDSASKESVCRHLIVDRYPIAADVQSENEVYFRGTRPSTLSLLLGLIPHDDLTTSRAVPIAGRSCDSKKVISACEELFARVGMVPVGDDWVIRIIDWVNKGRRGEELSVVSPICPDYATEQDEFGREKYTFNGLKGGVGLTGRQLISVIRPFQDFIQAVIRPIKFSMAIYVADTEACSDENLKRVGMNRAEFVSKVEGSVSAIRKRVPEGITVDLSSRLSSGQEGWMRELADVRAYLGTPSASRFLIPAALAEIVEARRSLYRRWFGKSALASPLLYATLVDQIAQHGARGKLIAEAHRNPLIVSVGNRSMAPFYSLCTTLPTLCVLPRGEDD